MLAIAAEPGPIPALDWQRESPSEYVVEVTNASGPFVLVLADSYAPGWDIDGLPDGWNATHVEIDGYANGWRIDGRGDAKLRVRYGPQQVVQYATVASGAGLVMVLAMMVLVAWRGTVKRRIRES